MFYLENRVVRVGLLVFGALAIIGLLASSRYWPDEEEQPSDREYLEPTHGQTVSKDLAPEGDRLDVDGHPERAGV